MYQIDDIVKEVEKITFSPVNPEEFKRYAVCEVKTSDLYDKKKQPTWKGINDLRMGTINNNLICETCKNEMSDCPGHFGYIDLCMPVYNPMFINKVVLILNQICSQCSKLLLDDIHTPNYKLVQKTKKENKLTVIHKLNMMKHIVKCSNCGFIQTSVKYVKDGMLINKIVQTGVTKVKSTFYAHQALQILKKMDHKDIEFIGMNAKTCHPSWLIFEIIPVVPPCVRPSIVFGPNLWCEDDIVYKLVNLIKGNIALMKKLESTNHNYLEVYLQQLQWLLTTLIDNSIKSVPQSQHRNNGRPLKSLRERLKGKDGLIRGAIAGKRVDASARSVIDPDPCIDLDEVGVPIRICKILTFPEVVNEYNVLFLTELIENGPDKYPGANYVYKKTYNMETNQTETTVTDLKYAKRINGKIQLKLSNGDTVCRHLLPKDSVIFNRQPSLHKMSMMSHRVRPVPNKSFRLNPAVTVPYNADFDGDEMNIIVPQNQKSMREIKTIACVPKQIVSPQSGRIIINVIMDNVLGCYLLSDENCWINEQQLMRIAPKCPYYHTHKCIPKHDKIVCGSKYWSGRTVFSMIFPPFVHFNYTCGKVIIRNNRLIGGRLNKRQISGIVHSITSQFDSQIAANFIDDVQTVTNEFLKCRGFTVGYDDIKRHRKLKLETESIIKKVKNDIEEYIDAVYAKKSKLSPTDFEQNICNQLNKARDNVGSAVMKHINPNNAFHAMIDAGAKGNPLNLYQILGALGQQTLQWQGKQGRVPMIVNNRTYPCFTKHDISAEARGAIEGSYAKGLNGIEAFVHAQAGRKGVVDSAVKTADVGYFQRQVMKSLDNIMMHYDMTLRNEGLRVVSFVYATNNVNTTKLRQKSFELVYMSKASFIKMYRWNKNEVKHYGNVPNATNKAILRAEYKQLKYFRRLFTRKFGNNPRIRIDQSLNIEKIIEQSSNMQEQTCLPTPLSLSYIIEKVTQLYDRVRLNNNKNFPFSELNEYNCKINRAYIQSQLATKKLICLDKIKGKEQFDWILEQIVRKFYDNLIDPGASLGPIAAQSIGEPCTQLSIHYDSMVEIIINCGAKKHLKVPIGLFIDTAINTMPEFVHTLSITEDGKLSQILPIPPKWNIFVPSLDCKTGKVTQNRVIEFSRHPPNGSLMEIITRSGKRIIATPSHSFITKRNGIIQTIRGDDLNIGDVVPINPVVPTDKQKSFPVDSDQKSE